MEQRKLENYEYIEYLGDNGYFLTHYIIKEKNKSGCLYYAINIENFPETKPISFFELLDNYKESLTEDMVAFLLKKGKYTDSFWNEIEDFIQLLDNINKSIINDMIVDIHNKNDEKRIQEHEEYLNKLSMEEYHSDKNFHNNINNMMEKVLKSNGWLTIDCAYKTGEFNKIVSFKHVVFGKIVFESGSSDDIYKYLKNLGVKEIVSDFSFFKKHNWVWTSCNNNNNINNFIFKIKTE